MSGHSFLHHAHGDGRVRRDCHADFRRRDHARLLPAGVLGHAHLDGDRPCGHSSTASQTITVEDKTAPVISALPAPTTIECPATPSFTTPTVTDACGGTVTLAFADVTTPGSCPQGYSVKRTWTATD